VATPKRHADLPAGVTLAAPDATSAGPPRIPEWAGPSGDQAGLGACLARLDEATGAARTLGLPTADAEAVRSEAGERLGFPAEAYVVALVGGTGVGKSSLLNALAGTSVSEASARRPTTSRAVAWIPSSARADLEGLLGWLGIAAADVRVHDAPTLAGVAVLDLPDLDSIEAEHRTRVEEVLPRVDAVIWVTDPEKYSDAVLHDDFLRRWVPRLDRQIVVLNKVDRLGSDDAERVRRDLERELSLASDGRRAGRPPIILAAARPGLDRDGADGAANPRLDDLRGWLDEQVEAKAVIRARLGTAISAAVARLAADAGIDPGAKATAILDGPERARAIERATDELLRVVDLPALESQAVAATRARARKRGAGPAGLVTSLLYRFSGREAKVADPAGFLARWRDRGSLAPATEAVRASLTAPLGSAVPAVRPVLAASAEPAHLGEGLAAAVDRAVALRGREVPTSAMWSVIGLLQTVATLAMVFAVIWVVLWVWVKFPVDSVAVPVLGRLPMPLVFLAGALLAGYLIARLLGLHAGWVGRRWARGLRADVRQGVAREVETSAFAALDELEAARRVLWSASRATDASCAPR
jgi:hypothetical protein